MCKQKGVPYALVLTFVNFATSTACQKQSNGNAPLDVYIHILNVWAMAQCFLCQAYGIVIYVSVGLSTLLVSTGRAMRRPTNVERVIGLAPRFFVPLDETVIYKRLSGVNSRRRERKTSTVAIGNVLLLIILLLRYLLVRFIMVLQKLINK